MKLRARAFSPHKCSQKLGSLLPILQCGGLCGCFHSWGIVTMRLEPKVHIPAPTLLAENFPMFSTTSYHSLTIRLVFTVLSLHFPLCKRKIVILLIGQT